MEKMPSVEVKGCSEVGREKRLIKRAWTEEGQLHKALQPRASLLAFKQAYTDGMQQDRK